MRHATRPSTEQRASFMRVYVRRQLVAGGEYPTPAEVTEEVGGDVGLAMQVLDEFPEHERPRRPRRRPTMRRTSGRFA
jgi:hypothetical protein